MGLAYVLNNNSSNFIKDLSAFISCTSLLSKQKMSHVKFDSDVNQNSVQEKILAAKVEKFSDAVTLILRTEAVAKLKKLVYVFVSVRQLTPTVFTCTVDDSRDKISSSAYLSIKKIFNEVFEVSG